jgi:CubicO group peptidase (beta-lactamase class C family)
MENILRLIAALSMTVAVAALPARLEAQSTYFPEPGDDRWERRTPAQAGMDAGRLARAIAYADTVEARRFSANPRDLTQRIQDTRTERQETHTRIIGPVKNRGPVTGLILRGGYIVAEFGEPERVDMMFSASKSFISHTFGVALDRRLIRDVNDFVKRYVPSDGYVHGDYIAEGEQGAPGGKRPLFDSERNEKIKWDHLLRHTSEWEGVLFGKPHNFNRLGRRNPPDKPLQEPGTFYHYSNTRVNVLAASLLRVFRRPLPQVLKEHLMDPIGGSSTWEWHGYETSWFTIDGMPMQSVSGGGNWGGGVWMSAYDMARVGYLGLRRGNWNGKRILSEEFYRQATTPTAVPTGMGFMNFALNTTGSHGKLPRSAYYHSGAMNRIYVIPEHDMVVVIRWIDDFEGFMDRVLDSITSAPRAD